jgi:D-aspartate ligase
MARSRADPAPDRANGWSLALQKAFVLGDADLIRPLRKAGIVCAAALLPGDATRLSRYVESAVEPMDRWNEQADYVERLTEWALGQVETPVLFYQTDGDLVMVSRHRDVLARAFRFVIPDAELVEALVDKGRFADLAARLDLPVPRSRRFRAEDAEIVEELTFPLIVKPASHQHFTHMDIYGKAVRVDDAGQVRALCEPLRGSGVELLAQEFIPGPESRIESYHAYVDGTGDVVGEFTGRKIRTYPREFGHTSALEISDSSDVLQLGREVLLRLGLRGVAKVDFKRAADGRLFLLEVNPRFNLWHSAGAEAGVNLPAAVYGDLTGGTRPPLGPVRPGTTWWAPQRDWWAVNAGEGSRREWWAMLMRADVRSGFDWDDSRPAVRGLLWPHLRRKWRRDPSVRGDRGERVHRPT